MRGDALLGGCFGFGNPAIKRGLVGLDPAIDVALDVGGLVLALAHQVVLGVDVATGSCMVSNSVAAAGFFSAQALLATICWLFTTKP